MIITVTITFGIVCCGLWMVGGLQLPQTENMEVTKNMTPEGLYLPEEVHRALDGANMTQEELPEDVKEEVKAIRCYSKFSISKWKFDSKNKQITIYAIDIQDKDEVDDLQAKQISNWTIKIIHDVAYEEKRDQVWTELLELEENPELQIAGFDMGAGEVNMWVYNLTPENQALDGQKIHGWTIHIWKALTPTPTGTKG